METIQETINKQGVRHAETSITTEEWTTMLADGTITPKQLEVLLCFYREPNHEGVCNVLAQKYGGTWQFYNNAVWKAGKNVQEHLDRFEVVGVEEDGTPADQNVYWCILADGLKSKQGFVFMLKPELCEALQTVLYQQMLADYTELRQTHPIDEDGADEKYKWEKVTECYKKKSLVEIADSIKATNLVYTAYASPCIKWLLENKREEFAAELQKLAEGTAPFNQRIKEYGAQMKMLNKENVGAKSYFASDERTIASILSCYAPTEYTFYIDKLYQPLCKYLGTEPHKAGEKYSHFLQLLQPLVRSIEQNIELQQQIASQTTGCLQSNLLSAQDVCWAMFMSYPENLTFSQQHVEESINQKTSNSDEQLSMKKVNRYQKYIDLLTSNRNIVLTGAPGTGKTFMAKAIAAEMGAEVGFVQFHPSYDYTDFVEGLRPIHQEGNIGFERKDGVFKSFCIRALQNSIDARKSKKELSREQWLKIQYEKLLERVEDEGRIELELKTNGKTATVIDVSDNGNLKFKKSNSEEIDANCVSFDRLVKLSTVYQCKEDLDQIKNINVEIRKVIKGCNTTFYWAVLHYLYSNKAPNAAETNIAQVNQKDFVFIIDEINRGEISKIFGELFFSIDPGYRGTKGDVRTQYANLQDEPNVFDEVLKSADYGHFFIPDNVYIVGTMNDIDRSVESMDFAMRRRFAWVEVKAGDKLSLEMLDSLDCSEEAKVRMGNLNRAILKVQGLNEAYQIGAAYFKKMEPYDSFDQLWENHIKCLLSEYLRGNRNAQEELEKLHEAFNDTTDHTTEKASATEETTEASVAEQPQE